MKAKSDLTGDCKRPAEMTGPRTLCGATEWIRSMISGVLAAAALIALVLVIFAETIIAKISAARQSIAQLCKEFLKSVQEVKIALPPGNGRCEP